MEHADYLYKMMLWQPATEISAIRYCKR